MAYPKTFLRGLITKGSVTDERYVTSEAFQFQDFRAQRADNYNELSINWEDSDEAVDVLLNQKKESTDDLQFKVGFVRIPLQKVRSLLKAHVKDKSFAYERKPVDGNDFHGNLLADAKLSKSITKNLQHSLATLATASELYLRSDAKVPYLRNKKKRMPKVSVIIPVYGVEKYIERCVRSLFEQTLDNIEYLFIDDCTPDKSIEILKCVLEEYPNRKRQVIIHRMDQNSGQAAVRKWGMQNATGEYMIHCDSDDWVEPDMYRAMYEKGKAENADMIVCDYYIAEGNKRKTAKGMRINNDEFLEDMLTQNVTWALWNKMCSRSIFSNESFIYPEGNMGEDMVIILQSARISKKTVYLPGAFYNYYCNVSSITQFLSEDKCYRNFKSMQANVQLLKTSFERCNTVDKISDSFMNVEWLTKRQLWPLLHLKYYRHLWDSIYPYIEHKMLAKVYISLSDKFRILLTILHLYPIKKHIER